MVATTTTPSHGVHWVRRGTTLALATVLLLLVAAACGPVTVTTVTQGQGPLPCVPPAPTQPVTPPASGHLSYARTACGPAPLQVVWHPGETVQYQWLAAPRDPQPDGGDAPVLLSFDVFGPFPSHAAAQAEQVRLGAARPSSFLRDPMANPPSPLAFPPPLPVLHAPPIDTDTWSARPLTSTVQLPTTLALGYYVLLPSEVIGESATPNTSAPNGQTSQFGTIIQVIAP